MARFFIFLVLTLLIGCQDDTCRAMRACCDASSSLEGVGDACNKLASGTLDPKTCHSVLETLNYMYDDKKVAAPDACKLSDQK